ncbi:MAG TPA: hypothetical protein DIS65_05535 [Candidatus Marinimicrobia bacterium]|nr:hypothetical protein [Candidatus Neomarinimicrobiota bacterium]
MIKQETTQEVYNRQKCVGNSSVSKKEISFLLDQLDKRTVNLIKKKDMLVRQKTRVDNDLKQTENKIKRIREHLNYIVNSDKQVSISLKKQQSNQYIKGRFWWEGKQRDVQIGSEKTIMSILCTLRDNKLIYRVKVKRDQKFNWKYFQKDKKIADAVQMVGRIKAAGYILNKLIKEESLDPLKTGSEKPMISDEKKRPVTASAIVETENMNIDWYDGWKNKNFGENI